MKRTANQTYYVYFNADIDPESVDALIQILCDLVEKNASEVYLAISTGGGNIAAGMTLYSFLRGVPFKLIAHNIGNIDSVGNVVFLGAQERYACAHSTFLFHGVHWNFASPTSRLEEKDLREILEQLVAYRSRMGEIISDRSKLAKQTIGEFFKSSETVTAQFAEENGIVHGIRDFHVPAGAAVIRIAKRTDN